MKNTNKIINILFIAVISISLIGCQDDDKNVLPDFEKGGFVQFAETPILEVGLTTPFQGTVIDPNGNAAEYELSVSARIGNVQQDTLVFKTTNSFPFDVGFTLSDMASLYGLSAEDFGSSDRFQFLAKVTTDEGLVFDSSPPGFDQETGEWNGGTFNPTLGTPGLRSAMSYRVDIVE